MAYENYKVVKEKLEEIANEFHLNLGLEEREVDVGDFSLRMPRKLFPLIEIELGESFDDHTGYLRSFGSPCLDGKVAVVFDEYITMNLYEVMEEDEYRRILDSVVKELEKLGYRVRKETLG